MDTSSVGSVPPAFVAAHVATETAVRVEKAALEASQAVLDLIAESLGVGTNLDVSA